MSPLWPRKGTKETHLNYFIEHRAPDFVVPLQSYPCQKDLIIIGERSFHRSVLITTCGLRMWKSDFMFIWKWCTSFFSLKLKLSTTSMFLLITVYICPLFSLTDSWKQEQLHPIFSKPGLVGQQTGKTGIFIRYNRKFGEKKNKISCKNVVFNI